eukprot:3343966-Heterocapsa_arctica.AAC.1
MTGAILPHSGINSLRSTCASKCPARVSRALLCAMPDRLIKQEAYTTDLQFTVMCQNQFSTAQYRRYDQHPPQLGKQTFRRSARHNVFGFLKRRCIVVKR